MRLNKIKLAGFKSFVDPTTFLMPGQRLGIVGPNGCGKSNIIDAVRWVMGESSVRQLRGESMEDVIFNGSANRKPVGQASIELVFDNSSGKISGAWGTYNEVAVKRIISRGGQSIYQINNTRCRRRDITEIFLGTGLGPRSYAIIEQGTISRIIESKPEELRVFLEEAAGISKYKERRRETETRIRHTRENLDRLNDVREELEKQLQHLQRQARNAEKYKQYRVEEKQLKAQLLALRWRILNTDIVGQETVIRDQQTALEELTAELRSLETQLTEGREQQTEHNERLNRSQEKHYQVGSEIARLEQSLEHRRQLRQRQEEDVARTEKGLEQARSQMDSDQARLQELNLSISEHEQALAEALNIEADYLEKLQAAEQAMRDWQAQWESFNRSAAEQQRIVDVEKTRIEQLQRQQQQIQQRNERLHSEQSGFSDDGLTGQLEDLKSAEQQLAADLETHQARLEEIETRIHTLREQQTEVNHSLGSLQEQIQDGRGRLASLKTLQEAALGDDDNVLQDWLQKAGLQQTTKLAEELVVESGWEQAVETVLAPFLEARLIDDLTEPAAALSDFRQGELALLAKNQPVSDSRIDSGMTTGADTLIKKIKSKANLDELLTGVYTVDGLDDAFSRRNQLQNSDSVITRDGIWMGRHWLRVRQAIDETGTGVLQRERQIRELEQTQEQNTLLQVDQRQQLEQIGDELTELEQQRKQQQDSVNHCHREHARLESQVVALTQKLEQTQQRRRAITSELQDLQDQAQSQQEEFLMAQQNLQEASLAIEQTEQERQQLSALQTERHDQLQISRSQYDEIRRTVQAKTVASESLKSEYNALQTTRQRLQQQHEELVAHQQQLQETRPADDEPHMAGQMDMLLQTRLQTDQALSQARQELDAHNLRLQQLEQQRNLCQSKLQGQREVLEKLRLSSSEAGVRRQTLLDQLEELGCELSPILGELPEDAVENEWQARLEAVANRIQRLGAINLAAIEEFEQLSERKGYLDTQNDDLMEALNTLETAMARIDRETRSRFQEMYDQVNQGLQNLFPRLFGGGQAYLDLTDDDALEAGVTIMARPPGKRNGTIHLLSGGEKALTAVAFIFSIFQLNPAPFCMLDEVDAPLDDANVGRFGALLKEMSDQVQFIVVTHNKVTMEVVDHLIGVTMHEPGVSRLVSVDVDEAIRLAAI